jgi:hypothetical protein
MEFMNAQYHDQAGSAKLTSTILPASFNVNKIFFTILFSLYLALSLIYYIWAIDIIILLPTLLGLLAFILLSTRIRKEYVPMYIYIGLLATSFLISSLIVGRTDSRLLYVPIIFIVSSPGIAMILIRGYVYSWGGYIVFYGLAFYFFILMLSGYDGFSALTLTSYNGISITMLVACISLYIIQSMENKRIDLKPALVTLVISIWGIGRSGIASSTVLLFSLLFVRLRSKPKYIFIVLICLFGAYLFYDVLYIIAINNSFLSNAIETTLKRMAAADSARAIMWTNYFNNIDIFRLIFGVNVVEDPWPAGEINEYNYHNSFINLHLQTGFMGLLTMVLIIFAVFNFYRTNKVFLILLLTLILRSSTDLVIFFSRFDFIPFFFIFYFLKSTSFHVPFIKPLSACIRGKSSPWCKIRTNNISHNN